MEINLGREEPDYSAEIEDSEKPKKTKICYPQLTIPLKDGVNLPAKGSAKISYEVIAFRKKGYMTDGPEAEIEVRSMETLGEMDDDSAEAAFESFFGEEGED